jgi:hypothetical protein
MLYLDAKILNHEKKLMLIKELKLNNIDRDPKEKLKILVGLEKPNKKIGLRIIVVAEESPEDKSMILTMKKIDLKTVLEFPLSAILFVERLEIPKDNHFQKFSEHLLVKVSFVAE